MRTGRTGPSHRHSGFRRSPGCRESRIPAWAGMTAGCYFHANDGRRGGIPPPRLPGSRPCITINPGQRRAPPPWSQILRHLESGVTSELPHDWCAICERHRRCPARPRPARRATTDNHRAGGAVRLLLRQHDGLAGHAAPGRGATGGYAPSGGRLALRQRPRPTHHSARQRHRPVGRMCAPQPRVGARPQPHQPAACRRDDSPPRHCRAGGAHRRSPRCGNTGRAVLSARPVELQGLVARWQRGGERGWPPGAEIWRHPGLRAGVGSRAARRRGALAAPRGGLGRAGPVCRLGRHARRDHAG